MKTLLEARQVDLEAKKLAAEKRRNAASVSRFENGRRSGATERARSSCRRRNGLF